MKLPKIKNYKLFNFRPFVFGLVALILGVFLAYSFFISFWFIVGFGVAALLFVVLLITRKWHKFLRLHLTSTIIICVCFVLGFGAFGIRELVYRKNVAPEGVYYISAKVVSTTKYQDDLYKTNIDAVSLYTTNDYQTVKKLKYSGYVWINSEYKVGDKIGFVGKYTPIKHNSIKSITNDKAYTISRYSQVLVSGNSKNIFEKYKVAVWNEISNNVNEQDAGTAYAMLTGDKAKVDYSTKVEYQSAGIGHILAVSGLHVGFLALILSFFLNICRVNKKIRFVIITIILFLFSFLCGFSYSVLRASIMCVVLLYAGLRGKQYDGLSALCFASILILLFDAYQLFKIGFLLSFFAVFSMFCLSSWLDYYFSTAYIKKLSSALSVGISTSVGILPWQVHYFGYFPLLGILVNIITIPLASIGFMFSFVFVPITLIIPGAGFLLKVPEYILKGVDEICSFANSFPNATISAQISPVTIIVWYLAITLCSDYILLPKKAKIWTRAVSAACAILFLALNIGGVF